MPSTEAETNVGLSCLVTSTIKRKLEPAAAHERRSLTNMLEVLVDGYCRLHGIDENYVGSAKTLATTGKKMA